jgi:hypothetical protein
MTIVPPSSSSKSCRRDGVCSRRGRQSGGPTVTGKADRVLVKSLIEVRVLQRPLTSLERERERRDAHGGTKPPRRETETAGTRETHGDQTTENGSDGRRRRQERRPATWRTGCDGKGRGEVTRSEKARCRSVSTERTGAAAASQHSGGEIYVRWPTVS